MPKLCGNVLCVLEDDVCCFSKFISTLDYNKTQSVVNDVLMTCHVSLLFNMPIKFKSETSTRKACHVVQVFLDIKTKCCIKLCWLNYWPDFEKQKMPSTASLPPFLTSFLQRVRRSCSVKGILLYCYTSYVLLSHIRAEEVTCRKLHHL